MERISGANRLNPKRRKDGEIDFVDIEFGEQFNEGSFGQVLTGLWGSTKVVVKKAHFWKVNSSQSSLYNDMMRKVLREEHGNLAKISHPRCVRYYGRVEKDENTYLVMEYVEGGDLRSFIESVKAGNKEAMKLWTLKNQIQLVHDISEAISYLHSMDLVHRDLRPKNVLVEKVRESDGSISLRAKVCDFGLSRTTYGNKTNCAIGVYDFLAPENRDATVERQPTLESDIYSLGMTSWCVFASETPEKVSKSEGFFEKVKLPTVLLRNTVLDVIKRCLRDNPTFRPKVKFIVKEFEKVKMVVNTIRDSKKLKLAIVLLSILNLLFALALIVLLVGGYNCMMNVEEEKIGKGKHYLLRRNRDDGSLEGIRLELEQTKKLLQEKVDLLDQNAMKTVKLERTITELNEELRKMIETSDLCNVDLNEKCIEKDEVVTNLEPTDLKWEKTGKSILKHRGDRQKGKFTYFGNQIQMNEGVFKFGVRIKNLHKDSYLMIGMSPKPEYLYHQDTNKSPLGGNSYVCLLFVNNIHQGLDSDGRAFPSSFRFSKEWPFNNYTPGFVKGDEIFFEVDTDRRTVSYIVNGKRLGVSTRSSLDEFNFKFTKMYIAVFFEHKKGSTMLELLQSAED